MTDAPRPAPTIDPLDATDATALRSFSCRNLGEPWTKVLEELVRGPFADGVAAGDVTGYALRDTDGRIDAVIAVTFGPAGVWFVPVLAVRHGRRHRGYARRLKVAVLDLASAAGAEAVVSYVHVDNDAMLTLNGSLGARIEPVVADDDHRRCTIVL